MDTEFLPSQMNPSDSIDLHETDSIAAHMDVAAGAVLVGSGSSSHHEHTSCPWQIAREFDTMCNVSHFASSIACSEYTSKVHCPTAWLWQEFSKSRDPSNDGIVEQCRSDGSEKCPNSLHQFCADDASVAPVLFVVSGHAFALPLPYLPKIQELPVTANK